RCFAGARRNAFLQSVCVLKDAPAGSVADRAATGPAAGSYPGRSTMNRLYVLFDAQCELCVRCCNWLMKQPAFVPLAFIALQSDEVQRRFSGIDALKPNEQLLVVSNEGSVY